MRESAGSALTRQRELLRKEYDEDRESFRRLTGRIGVIRLVEQGNAWWPVRYTGTRRNSLDQMVVEVRRDPTEEYIDHNFEYGKPVTFFRIDSHAQGKIDFISTGIVSFVDGDRMSISVADSFDRTHISEEKEIGIMLSFDETTYRVMFEALDRVTKAKGRLGELRDLIYSGQKAEEMNILPRNYFYLNSSQEAAVNKVLCTKDISIVHGPPGTGKTTTLVEAIYETLHRESQVMVCAQSNMAVDWISEQLIDRGVNVLRIGNPTRVNDKMLSFTYERRFESHPDYPTLWSIRRTIRQLYSSRKGSDSWRRKVDHLKEKASMLELKIREELLREARVIACTLVGSASKILTGMKFPTLFIDEAAQALEAACWIAASKSDRIILAGDHCQLPPTVKSLEALRGGLGKSLMERIVENHPESVSLLTVQYRMHEDIMDFPNREFYNGKMKAAPQVAYRGILDLDTAIEWIDTSTIASSPSEMEKKGATAEEERTEKKIEFQEYLTGEGTGRINKGEACLTVNLICDYIERVGAGRFIDENIDIGVISPYRAQVRYLRKLISREKRLKSVCHLISVNTVDGFQGQERDIIVISLVRNNSEGNIGFLKELRRMNVAMTRAKKKLLIIGDVPTLTHTPFYHRLHTYISGETGKRES